MMRWRTATEEVAASASDTSPTISTSRRSLNEQAEEPEHTTTHDIPEKHGLEEFSVSDSASNSVCQMRGTKRALEEEKKQASTIEPEPPDTADTDTSNSAQENSAFRSSNGSSNRRFAEGLEDDDDGADHAEEESSPTPTIAWQPQNVQSTCEFTHTILDYAQKRESGCKKAEYSAVTQDELGNRWRLIVYVNGNGRASNHHLSLFLQVADADDLPFGWKKAVSYVLTLEHPTEGTTLSYAKRNPDKTFKLCPKAIDWGWSQFITSDRIQQEGFVKVDTLTVRAQVTVKSSSVAIDEEDAELYLKCAVEEGDAKSVKLCSEQGASVNCQFKDDLYTPLHTACSSGTNTGSLDVLNLLLEQGADGNACNKWKETPLLIAANNGHRAAVEALLNHGASPSLCSEAGWSALTFAAHKGYEDIVALLLSAGAPVNCPVTEDSSTPLHKACAGSKPGHIAAVKLLLDGGADVHALNKWRETPLLTAANHGQAGAVEALLAADADPCKCTDTGWSPLSIAAYKGHDEVVRLLLEDGAPTEEDDPTLSALLQAATKGLPDTVELLLRHGADHTVTTKKGDTALSILVEQNLIDAAVEMVTEYNASIPRCSRDRKKVQRARLLINLRMKQLDREGKDDDDSTDDDEETDEDHFSNATVAQHIENGSLDGSAGAKPGRKNKKGIPKESAEEKARLAEQALLQELEKEDAQAKMEEAKANSKQAKKKKKKERERLLKMKEEEERRKQKEREAIERECIRKEQEEERRKEREEQEKAEREREVREMIEREKGMAAKRKERERREREQKLLVHRGSGSISPVESRFSTGSKAQKSKKASTDPTPNRKIVSPKGGKKPVVPLVGNRRWETAAKDKPSNDTLQSSAEPARLDLIANFTPSLQKPVSSSSESSGPSAFLSPRLSRMKNVELTMGISHNTASPSVSPPLAVGKQNGSHTAHSQFIDGALEHPAITLFRREKVTELLQRCTQSFNLVGDLSVNRMLHRWIVRSSHGKTLHSDPIIPSWIDFDQLVAYFQRQFIAESRRKLGAAIAGPSLEALKEAGSSVAMLCQNMAKQVLAFRSRINEQLSPDWTDAALGMTASDGTLTGNGSFVTVSWANRAQVVLPSLTFATLRDRHVGSPSRFLAAVFVTRMLYDTTQLIVSDTYMDVRLSLKTQASLSAEAGVSAELWSDPFSALNSNVFWGRFEQVDVLFGGQKPFGKDENGSEEVLARHGGSLSVFLPLDAMVASQYVQRMVDILDLASAESVPVSFAVFFSVDCFHDLPSQPCASDLCSLDPRLVDQKSAYVTRVEALHAGQHTFLGGEGAGTSKICSTNSLFVMLQNNPGKSRYNVGDTSASRIIATLSVNSLPQNNFVMATSVGLTNEFHIRDSHLSATRMHDLTSTNPQIAVRSEFGAIGGSSFSNNFAPAHEPFSRGNRRGRLFDLVDDGDEEYLSDEIMTMSGMLNNLDVGLFQNTSIGSDNVDIEAISLMGIGGSLHRSLSNPGNAQPRQLG